MQVQLSKWGNSLGLRLPRALADQLGVGEGQKVNITAEGGRLIIEPVARPRYTLQELLANVTPGAIRESFDWGSDEGRERVDD
jgi:antitoxin MazE